MEIWKDVLGYERFYQVSNFGRVKSLSRIIKRSNGSNLPIRERFLSICVANTGYCVVGLLKDGKQKNKLVHRLVAEAFISNLENKPEINHIDGNKSNNLVPNLEWITKSEHGKHRSISGQIRKGEDVNFSKLTSNEVREIRDKYIPYKYTQVRLAKEYGVDNSTISRLINHVHWEHI